MSWWVIILIVMVAYSGLAAGAEKRGDRTSESGYQGVVTLGWIILIIVFLIHGC